MLITTFDIYDGTSCIGGYTQAFTDKQAMYKHWVEQDQHPFLSLTLVEIEVIPL